MSTANGQRQTVILLVPPELEDRVTALSLDPPLRTWRCRLGVLVHGAVSRDADPSSWRAAGAREFLPTEVDGLWAELAADVEGGRSAGTVPGSEPPREEEFLLEEAGNLWAVPPPERWPPLAAELRWGLSPVRDPLPRSLPGWELSLAPAAPPQGRDGVLLGADAGKRIGSYLSGLSASELREHRLGEAEGCSWIFAPRGLDEGFPREGVGLKNLGTSIEPVLVPVDRKPSPELDGPQLREVFGAREGEGVLWWSGQDGEEYVVFKRSRLAILSAELVLGRRW